MFISEALTIDFYNGNRSIPHLKESPPLCKETTSKSSRDPLTTQNNNLICTDNTNEENQLLSQRCSTGDILDLECQTDSNTYNNSLVDINENGDSVVSIEDSLSGLRRLSYRTAIGNEANDEVNHKDSIGQDFVCDKKVDHLDSKTNTKAQTQCIDKPETGGVNLRNSIVDDMCKQTGDSITGGTALEDYCWNDSMVVFDDDISYSSYSFSHLSYPFQPLRQEIVVR